MPQDSIVDRLVELAHSQDTIIVKPEGASNLDLRSLLFEGPLSPSTTASSAQSLPSHPAQPKDNSLIVVLEAGGRHVFRDTKSAALFLLLLDQTPISEFVSWATQQRNGILQAPTKDSSLDGSLLPVLMTTTTTAGSFDHTYPSTAVARSVKPISTPSPDKLCETTYWAPPDVVSGAHNSTAAVSASSKVRRSEIISAYPGSIALDPPKAKRPRTLSHMTQTVSSENEGRVINGAVRARGSTRRLPELEGVIVCPDCSRKGQSIFDPNNSNREGVVWQYFYCRNVDCVRGRSSSRYIGWTTRRKGT